MPEEKKKESFTFSDKIKNSKPANSKSFAKRSSSKIGSDGKPRQTLFERTKRDAPFFIAALVALLLLPFLYKYSGNAEEEPMLVTPGYEDSAFNPERSGFDGFAVDPEGQIAQLTGRDPLELIGLGRKATEEVNEDEDFLERSAYSGEGSSASNSLDEQDEEENTTNIYQYRKKAPAATRAAFRRAATPINRLSGASRVGASGSKLGVGMWGGSIKPAANKVKGSSPQSAPKPVSLQPLQAAGKPTKAYFGQPNSQLARKSKDAMSKGNAMQALMDSNFKPVEPGKFGGVIGGDFGGPGGGKGDMKREFNYNAKEPWWWDMMKQKAMMDWKAKFDLKWKAINKLADIGLHWLEGILNCLFTGNDDGDMGAMFGTGASTPGSDAECCGLNQTKFEYRYADKIKAFNDLHPNEYTFEGACKALKAEIQECKDGKGGGKFKGGSAGSKSMTAWQARKNCLGVRVKGYTAGETAMPLEKKCEDLAMYREYNVTLTGEARKWQKNANIYLVVRNEMPEIKDETGRVIFGGKGVRLCDHTTHHLEHVDSTSVGVGTDSSAVSNVNKKKGSNYAGTLGTKQTFNVNSLDDSCVIHVTNSTMLVWDRVREDVINALQQMKIKVGNSERTLTETEAEQAFNNLVWLKAGSIAGKEQLASGTNALSNLPMTFRDFNEFYLKRYGTTSKRRGSKDLLNNRKFRTENMDVVYGQDCDFEPIQVTCDENSFPATARVIKGQDSQSAGDVSLTAHFVSTGKDALSVADQTFKVEQSRPKGSYQFTFTNLQKAVDAITENKEIAGTVQWTVTYTKDGKSFTPAPAECGFLREKPTIDRDIPPKEDPKCKPGDEEKSEKCCRELMGEGYKYDPNRQPPLKKCYKPEDRNPNPKLKLTCLAKQLVWVPADYKGREDTKEKGCLEIIFNKKRLIPKKGKNHCDADMGIEQMKTQGAKTFVKKVVDAYNKQNPDQKIQFNENYITLGEFVDALNIAHSPQIAIADVPKEAVREMAHHVVRRAPDPHSNGKTWGEDNRPFYNTLGAYLAYVHEDSGYYPAFYTEEKQRANCDMRFMPAVPKNVNCPKNDNFANVPNAKKYYNQCYTWKCDRSAYKDSLKALGIVNRTQSAHLQALGIPSKDYPLAALAEGVSPNYTPMQNWGCRNRKEEYMNAFGYLVDESRLEGNMPVADALSYITGVCEVGLNKKPYGKCGEGKGGGQHNISGRAGGASMDLEVR